MYIHYNGREIYIEPDEKVLKIGDIQIWFKGYFFIEDVYYSNQSAAEYIYSKYNSVVLRNIINSCNGIFTCIMIKKDEIIICNDRFGFGQLFYVCKGLEYYISDDYWMLQSKSNSFEIDSESALEILQIRYVLGERTLLKGINWILPSSIYQIKNIESGFVLERDEYWNFKYCPQQYSLEEASLEVFQILDRIIKKYLALGISDSKIGINMTGGLDSRFILSLLLKNEIDTNSINSYTYGANSSDDITITKELTSKLGIKHHEAIFNNDFCDFFKSETINNILYNIGFTTSYLQGYGISKVNKLYKNIDYLLTGSDGFFVGLMANDELFSIKNKQSLVDYIYKKNATILNPKDLSFIYLGVEKNFEKSLKHKISDMINDNNTDYISMFYEWTIKNRLRKYILSIYEILNDKTTALFPFYDYEFLDCMARLPYALLKNQDAYFNALYKFALTGPSEKLRKIPIEANRRFYKQGESFHVERKKEPIFRKVFRKLFSLPDNTFAFPIYRTFTTAKGVFHKKAALLFDKNSKILMPDNSLILIKKYRRKEHFFRYGLIAIITIFRFEQLIKDKIENR